MSVTLISPPFNSPAGKELWSLKDDEILIILVKKRRSLNFHFKDKEPAVVLEKDKLTH